MKAILNIGLRTVTIEYSIDKNSRIPMEFDSSKGCLIPINNGDCGVWEMSQKTMKSKTIQCTQRFSFRDADEWLSIQLLDGRIIDFHYDYEERSEFNNKKEWASYIFQGYLYIEGEEQRYDKPVVDKVVVKL